MSLSLPHPCLGVQYIMDRIQLGLEILRIQIPLLLHLFVGLGVGKSLATTADMLLDVCLIDDQIDSN